jgi:hypothetical protein
MLELRFEVRMEDTDDLVIQGQYGEMPTEGDTIRVGETTYLVEARRFDFYRIVDQPELAMGVVLVSEVVVP